MDLRCNKCGYILLEDCEAYTTINGKYTLIGFYCRSCGDLWIDTENYTLSSEEIEKIKEKYKNSIIS